MIDQLFETFRKASESSLLAQQDLFRQWTQQWTPTQANGAGQTGEWGRAFQKRWLEFVVEALNKHREMLDSSYRSAIDVIEQTLRISEARSPDDYRRMFDELGRKLFDSFKLQSETQFREFQTWAEKSFEMGRPAEA
jgi:hypothetical protein